FRGHGIGARVMQALDKRLEQLCDRDQLPYHLMMETSQLSVIGLGKKIGMVLTAGEDIFDSIQSGDSSYQIDEDTHVTDANNYRMLFRVSKAYLPEAQVISIRQGKVREQIYALAA
ncbi:MAG: hypothetical protein U1C97_00520, partial [Candidatus Gracilibacteria bacterium]|nr:hypothetical protein [Candidatus Gracilibacteria bacterium]